MDGNSYGDNHDFFLYVSSTCTNTRPFTNGGCVNYIRQKSKQPVKISDEHNLYFIRTNSHLFRFFLNETIARLQRATFCRRGQRTEVKPLLDTRRVLQTPSVVNNNTRTSYAKVPSSNLTRRRATLLKLFRILLVT